MTQKTSLLKYVMSLMLVMLGFASQSQTPTYDMYVCQRNCAEHINVGRTFKGMNLKLRKIGRNIF